MLHILKKIEEEINTPNFIEEGAYYYLLSCDWFQKFKEYLDSTYILDPSIRPPPINNSSLMQELHCTNVLKECLLEGKDFYIISKGLWNSMVDEYVG